MGQLKKRGWVKETKKADEISEEEIRKVFDIVDKDKSGSLSRREAKRACKLIGEKFGITEVTEMFYDVSSEQILKYFFLRSRPGLLSRMLMVMGCSATQSSR